MEDVLYYIVVGIMCLYFLFILFVTVRHIFSSSGSYAGESKYYTVLVEVRGKKYTYLAPPVGYPKGTIVSVPFGNDTEMGVVVDDAFLRESQLPVPRSKMKYIDRVITWGPETVSERFDRVL